jgi:signal transduction histidine kinase
LFVFKFNVLSSEWKAFLSRRWWLLGSLLVALIALAVAQFRWIDEVNRAERQHAIVGLNAALSSLKTEFDLEVTRALAVFELPVSETSDYTMRYTEWLHLAPYPKTLLGVYAVAKDASGTTLRSLIPGETTPDSTNWKTDAARLPFPSGQPAPSLAASASALVPPGPRRLNIGTTIAGNPAFVFPILSRSKAPPHTQLPLIVGNLGLPTPSRPELMPGAFGSSPSLRTGASLIGNSTTDEQWAVAVFDAAYITATLLPEMLKTRLPPSPTPEYQVSVITNGGPTPGHVLFRSDSTDPQTEADHPDGKIEVFQPRLDCLLQLGGSNPLPDSQKGIGSPGLSDILARRSLPCGDSPVALNAPRALWTLKVAYRSASLDYVMVAFRRRNIVFSGGVLLVLGVGIGTLIVLTKRAAVLAQMQTDFVLGISHELRTPLTVIRVAGNNLLKGMAGSTEQAHKYGQIITQQATELSNMIEDTLVLARIQPCGRRARTRGPVSCHEVLSTSLARWDRHLRDAGFDVTTDVPLDLPLIDADSQMIIKCLENLIQNALKYACSGRWLRIRARKADQRRGDCVEISVEDRGPGIPPTDLPQIFEPFYRGKSGRVLDVPGIGLGLTLVKRVVEAHDGRVEVNGSAEGGTVFSVFLPCYDGARNGEKLC